MTTARFRPTTAAEAVERARSMCGSAGAKIVYRLADHSGGRDPNAADPASHWRTLEARIAVASCDCAGFVAWSLGFDRYQPVEFPLYGGWINVDSAIQEARTTGRWFAEIKQRPEPGDVVCFPSVDLDHDGSRDRVGHIGLIVGVSDRWFPGSFAELRVVHCSGGHQRRLGHAIAESDGTVWAGADHFAGQTNPRWGATILRYRRFAAVPAVAA